MTGKPLLCATVTGDTSADLRRARDAAGRADLVEVRLDFAADPDVRAVVADRRVPVLVTCRASWEGGRFRGAEEEREALLVAALQAGAEYVDVEWAAPFRSRLVQSAPDRVVVSAHDFDGIPPDLGARYHAMLGCGAAVAKVAVTARTLSDQLPLFELGAESADAGARHVLLAMGPAGVASRVLAARLGNCWTYAGDAVAPGQISAARLLEEYRYRRISAGAAVYGVLGRPVTHSLSPAIHNAALEAAGLDAAFVALEAATFDDFERFASAIGLQGAAVTAPFKLDAFRAAGSMDALARQVGAVNTLRRDEAGSWTGRNTDVAGFLAPLRGETLRDRRVTVLGAGGAARAVIVGLVAAGARVAVSARRAEAAEALAREYGVTVAPFPPSTGSWDVLVNTTPVGTWPKVEESPLPAGVLAGEGLVYDLVYNPPDTALMRVAREAGGRVRGGLDMLVAQAGEQFTFWTGHAPPLDVMRDAAERALDARRR